MLIGLLGRIGSGKGTVADRLVNTYNFKHDSFAASLKDVTATLFNWDRAMLEGDTPESRAAREIVDPWWSEKLNIPNFTPRLALQLIGTDVFRNHFHQDIWMLSAMSRYRTGDRVVISDARFPNEISAIREAGGIIVCVDRGSEPEWWATAVAAAYELENLAADAVPGEALVKMRTTYANIHQSEWAWAHIKPDYIISNNGSLELLYARIDDFANRYSLS